jgi:hypothetical protein
MLLLLLGYVIIYCYAIYFKESVIYQITRACHMSFYCKTLIKSRLFKSTVHSTDTAKLAQFSLYFGEALNDDIRTWLLLANPWKLRLQGPFLTMQAMYA